ncbi:MAG: hypothetical protein ACRDZ8_00700 [Acidimicrobiales bacterium]
MQVIVRESPVVRDVQDPESSFGLASTHDLDPAGSAAIGGLLDPEGPEGSEDEGHAPVHALNAASFSTLRRAIEQSQRFHSDSVFGRVLHRGTASYRELSPVDAVHITVAGNRLSAHVDDVSPVKQCADGKTRYSWARVLAHNVFAIAADLARRLGGSHGEHRCNLDCEVVWVDDDGAVELSCEEVECPTCTDEGTLPRPAGGRE